MPAIPPGIVAAVLNKTERRVDRHDVSHRSIPYVHVSSLIKADAASAFCPREFALRYLENLPASGNSVPAKFEILYDMGHAIGDKTVSRFIRRSANYGHHVWGDWTCACEETTVTFCHKPENLICNKCAKPVDRYKESDIRDDKIHVVGHADLLLCNEEDVIYIYEIKSIDRADVDFDTMEEPLGDHVVQASFYYWLLIAKGYKVHKYVRILYIDRSLTELYRKKPYKEFSALRISSGRIMRLAKKAMRAHRACETRILPDRICKSITDSRAMSCRSAISCFARNNKRAKKI